MSLAERSMGLGLRALGRIAGSDMVDRLGVRKPAERVLYRATRDGFRAAGAAGRSFKVVRNGGKAKRLSTTTSSGLFDLHPTDEQQMLQEAFKAFAAERLRPAALAADGACATPPELLAQAGELGLTMLGVPEDLGGAVSERSSVTAVLAAEALGPGHVTGVAMPTRYSSAHSLADAETLARNLGIRFHTIPIDAIFQSHLDALAPALPGALGVAEENIQARVRGAVLMAFSNTEGSMLLSTGNKSELAVGYCTLYGDMCGGLAAISDVPKTLVYDLARYVNREREVIPRSSITKAPSAELRPNQTDQDTLPPYEVIDAVIEGYVEKDEDIASIVAGGIAREVAESIIGRIDRNEYKRRQAAPGLKITLKAFGVGRRYPIAADYRSLGDLKLGEPVPEAARPGR